MANAGNAGSAQTPELIVMLTHNDRTVPDAPAVFEECRNARATCWGMKEEGLPLEQMKSLYARMRECGKTTFLEVVAYAEAECLAGARIAVECGCDYLMGTMFSDAVNVYCGEHGLRYLPFVGSITGRPSVLEGTLDDMVEEARSCVEKGAFGIDLLGYRYTGDAVALNRAFVAQVPAPVVLAGSVNSYERLVEVKEAAPWAFTIGGAFFEGRFGGTMAEQIDAVCEFMSR